MLKMAAGKYFSLYTGGKDSTGSLIYSLGKGYDVDLLVTIEPMNLESYMFHPYNLKYTVLQALLLDKKIIYFRVSGEKEREVEELVPLLEYLYDIGYVGIVAGGLFSEYQRRRFERVSSMYGFDILSPFWGLDQRDILYSYIDMDMKFMITSVAANGLDRRHLGWVIDDIGDVEELMRLADRYGFNPTGEGGEYESFVLYVKGFKGELIPEEYEVYWDGYTGYITFTSVSLRLLEDLRVMGVMNEGSTVRG